MRLLKLCVILTLIILIISSLSSIGISERVKISDTKSNNFQDDFYFVQITDTHVLHEKFEKNESSKTRLKGVLEKVCSFEKKPDFIVITGDLVHWGGRDPTGKMNYQAFVECLYKKNDKFYADPDFTIPIHTIPGNHDYMWENTLYLYHEYIDSRDKYVLADKDLTLIFMDSGFNYISDPRDWTLVKGSGLYDEDIDWLEDKLNSCDTKNKIILMHHPAVNSRNSHGEMTSVIARNRVDFLDLCEKNDVDLVLTGHTHSSRVFDAEENRYDENSYPYNCSKYPTLYVQTEDCKDHAFYRNITFIDDDIWLEKCEKVPLKRSRSSKNQINFESFSYMGEIISNILKIFWKESLIRQLLMKL
jgi:3',5'-cyclic AMP phosphodiesterase CpdA